VNVEKSAEVVVGHHVQPRPAKREADGHGGKIVPGKSPEFAPLVRERRNHNAFDAAGAKYAGQPIRSAIA